MHNLIIFYIWRVKCKSYIVGLVVALACFGMWAERPTVPNQEIVVQFVAGSFDSEDADAAISEITDQLKTIGVTDIRISKMLGGRLHVAYFSTIDVAVIKDLFSRQQQFYIGDTAFNERGGSSKIPYGGHSGIYKLEVVKIQRDYGPDSGFQGLPVAIKSLKDQYLKQVVSFGGGEICFGLSVFTECEICNHFYIATFPNAAKSHKIPEVRAGPLT